MSTLVAVVDNRGTMVAADTQVSAGDSSVPCAVEKFQIWGKWAIGFCGDAAAYKSVARLSAKHKKPPKKVTDLCSMLAADFDENIPKLKDDFEALLVEQGKIWNMDSHFDALLIETPFYAIGSGAKYANGSLYRGGKPNILRDPEDGVRAAAFFDCYTGGRIDVWRNFGGRVGWQQSSIPERSQNPK